MASKTRVDIDFSQLGINWTPGESYTIQLGEGFVIEDGGEQQPSPANNLFFTFNTNTTGASIFSTAPVPTTILTSISTIVFNYTRRIGLSTGKIELYRVDSPDVLVHTYNTDDQEVTLGLNNTSIEINLSTFVSVPGVEYYFLFDADVVRDADNFASPAVTNASLFRYTSPAVPTLVSTTPADNAIDVTNALITLTFDQYVRKGFGFIKLINTSTGVVRSTFDVANSSNVTVLEDVVSLDASFILESSTNYHITIDNGAILGQTGVPYAGIADNTTFNFTTDGSVSALTFITTDLYNSLERLTIVYPSGVVLKATTANEVDNINGVSLFKLVGGTGVLVHKFYHNKLAPEGESSAGGVNPGAEMNSSNNGLRVHVTSYLEANSTYYILVDNDAYFNDNTNLTLPEISDTTLIKFTFTP